MSSARRTLPVCILLFHSKYLYHRDLLCNPYSGQLRLPAFFVCLNKTFLKIK